VTKKDDSSYAGNNHIVGFAHENKNHLSVPAHWAKNTLLALSIAASSAWRRPPGGLAFRTAGERRLFGGNKGDLDAAMQCYQQIVAEAKAAKRWRRKRSIAWAFVTTKRKITRGAAAFEKLAKDYPDQKELVAAPTSIWPGHGFAAGAVADGEELRLTSNSRPFQAGHGQLHGGCGRNQRPENLAVERASGSRR